MGKKLLFALGFLFGTGAVLKIFLELAEKRVDILEMEEDLAVFERSKEDYMRPRLIRGRKYTHVITDDPVMLFLYESWLDDIRNKPGSVEVYREYQAALAKIHGEEGPYEEWYRITEAAWKKREKIFGCQNPGYAFRNYLSNRIEKADCFIVDPVFYKFFKDLCPEDIDVTERQDE